MSAFAEGLEQNDTEVLGRYDDATAAFAGESFPTRVIRELQHFRRSGDFPLISVLNNSYFAWPIEICSRCSTSTGFLL